MKPRHLWYVFDHVPGLVGHVHLHQHIARKELALAASLLTVAHFDDFLGRNQDLAELVLPPALDALFQRRAFTLLSKPGIGMHDIPAHRHDLTPFDRSTSGATSTAAKPVRSPGTTPSATPRW